MGGTLRRVSFILAMNHYTGNDVTAAGTSGAPELLGSAYSASRISTGDEMPHNYWQCLC